MVPAVLAAPTIESKNECLCKLMYATLVERFGTKPRRNNDRPPPANKHCPHNCELKRLRKQKIAAQRLLRQAHRERRGQEELRQLGLQCHKAVQAFNKALHQKSKAIQSSHAARARKECAGSFWIFASRVLDEGDAGPPVSPAFDAELAEQHFKEVYDSKPHLYTHPTWLPQSKPPLSPFNSGNIQPEEMSAAIEQSRSSSSPSPIDQIPYMVFKKCPSLLPALMNLYNLCWEFSAVPKAWKIAVISLIPKMSAAEDPSKPGNFHPIALTSCVGKIFTSVMKTRLHSHMSLNGYLDNNIQKAFQPKVPGCIEHYTKLAAAVSEALKCHKSLTVCWLDLANAFSSVHHQLISFTLRHYHAPKQFVKLVDHLYTDLFVSVSTKDWSSAAIPLKTGVFQGDPLSVEIFNTVMNTYIDAIKPHLTTYGYHFSGANHTLGLLQYADDTCLISNGPASCKQMLKLTEEWLKWSGRKPKVGKCQCVALESSSSKLSDPNLALAGEKIPFVGKSPVHFLGGTIQISTDQQQARDLIQRKLANLLSRVDATPVTRKQKLHLYRLRVCLRITWDLTISDFPISWVEKTLDPLATQYLKRWLGLARPADPSRLYLPQEKGSLELPSVSLLYQKMHVGKVALLMISRDAGVQYAMKFQLQQENQAQRKKFRPATLTQGAFANFPEASRKTLTRMAKNEVQKQDVQKRLAHATSLQVQGKFFQWSCDESALAWSRAVQSSSSPLLKFAINAAQDTLPHNANLALWRNSSEVSAKCKLCGDRQTLANILNCCQTALNSRRYNERHDEVLAVIAGFLREELGEDFKMMADTGPEQNYLFPPNLTYAPTLCPLATSRRKLSS